MQIVGQRAGGVGRIVQRGAAHAGTGVVLAHGQRVATGGQPLIVPKQEILGFFVGSEVGFGVVPGAGFQGHYFQASLGQAGQQRRAACAQPNHYAVYFITFRLHCLRLLLWRIGGYGCFGQQGTQQRVLNFGLYGTEDAFFEDFFVGHIR